MLFLTENEKLFILIFASSLFLLSVIITICVVSPICLFHKWFFKSQKKQDIKICYPTKLLTQESKHFQLSVVPHYGANNDIGSKQKINETNDFSILIDKNKPKKCSIASDSTALQENTSKIKLEASYETVSNISIRLEVKIIEVCDLQQREYLVDPSCYVSIILLGLRNRRKSLINKAIPSELYRTATAKRCLNPVFNETFKSQDLPKSILKDGLLKLKVYDDERYANDICLGEVTIPLKKFDNTTNNEMKMYNLCFSKESKGELLIGLCYLPTSKRVTVSIVKATVNHTVHNSTSSSISYYIRVLMFINGKLTKKKKTATSQKMIWGDNETLTFDLMSANSEETAFMLVLSSKLENSPSPSSPETPGTTENGNNKDSRKDRHIGNFIIGKEFWVEMKRQPRKQILKWHKLY